MTRHAPPRLAVWLLDRLAPRGWQEAFRGDLDEEFAARAARSRRAAIRWYWRQSVRAAVAGVKRRAHRPRGDFMSAFLTDVRFGLRLLARQRLHALFVIVTLGASLGTAAAAASLVRAYAWAGLPYPAADRLVTVQWAVPDVPVPDGLFGLPTPDVSDIAELSVAWDIDGFTLVGGGAPVAAGGRWIRPDAFAMFGAQPLIGRTFTDEDVARGESVAVISRRLWLERFDGADSVLGRSVTVRSTDRPDEVEVFTIVGVLPDRFWHLGGTTDLLLPLRGDRLPSLLRLAEGVTPEQAGDRLTAWAAAQTTSVDPRWHVTATPMQQAHVEPISGVLSAITLAVGLLVVVTFGNLTLLQLARGLARHRELAVRAAMGASRARLVRQLVVEHGLLGLASGLVAIASAALLLGRGLPAIEQYLGRLAPGTVGSAADSAMVTPALAGLTVAAAVAVAVVSGLLPAIRGKGARLTAVFGGHAASADTPARARARQVVVLSQVAGAFALLAGAALLVASARHLGSIDLGLDPEHVISANMTLHERSYMQAADRRRLIEAVTERIERLPGVEAAGVVAGWPFAPYPGDPVEAVGRPALDPSPVAARYAVNAAYFRALGLRLQAGRVLVPGDADDPARPVVVSSSLAAELWPDESAIGRTIRFPRSGAGSMVMAGMAATDPATLTVVGVVADVSRILVEDTAPEVYEPLERSPGSFLFLQIRTDGLRPDLVPRIEQAVLAEDPNLPLADVRPMADVVGAEGVRPAFLATVLSAFAALTALVTLAGIYAVSAWIARQRRREAAVRLALGATAGTVVRLFVGRGAVVIAAGLVVGWVLSLWLGAAIEAELAGISGSDAGVRAAVAAALGAVGLLAVWLPARRVSSEDPAQVLRDE